MTFDQSLHGLNDLPAPTDKFGNEFPNYQAGGDSFYISGLQKPNGNWYIQKDGDLTGYQIEFSNPMWKMPSTPSGNTIMATAKSSEPNSLTIKGVQRRV